MAEVRPVKPGIYAKIVDVARTPDELWKRIDVQESFKELQKTVSECGNQNKVKVNRNG